MEIVSCRLVKQTHLRSAFDGEGARIYGGRWNSPGVPVVYTSESLALCCLEIFVHLPSYSLLHDYAYIEASFHADLVEEAPLIDGWDARPVSHVSQTIGDRWVKENRRPVLRVPSVVIPDGSNYLLNVNHPEFNKIKVGTAKPVDFDARLNKE